jgi:hypothetical protein
MDYVSAGLTAYQIVQSAQEKQEAQRTAEGEAAAYRAQQASYRDQELAASERAVADELAAREAEAKAADEADEAKARTLAEKQAADEERLARDAAERRAATRARLAAGGVSSASGSAQIVLRNLLEEAESDSRARWADFDEDLDVLDRLKAARARRLAHEREKAETSLAQVRARRRLNLLTPPAPPRKPSGLLALPSTVASVMPRNAE